MKSRVHNLAAMVTMVALMALTACANLNPLNHAETVQQKAYALYGTFVVYEEQAAAIVQDVNVPSEVKSGLSSADAVAKPLADKLLAAALSVDQIRLELQAGKSTEEKLTIATANLERWYEEAGPKIRDLVAAVQGARR